MKMIGNPVFIAALFGLAMLAVSLIRKRSSGLDVFLVADRSVGTWTGALSAASTWIWAPALFIAAQKAYQQGIAGLMWFTVPNVGSLVLFAFLAVRIRNRFPKGYTLPEFIAAKFDTKTHLIYLFGFFSLQICSLAVQLIAGAAMLSAMSSLGYKSGVVLLAVLFTAYSLIDGLRTSIRTDLIQMLIILAGIVILVPESILKAGGMKTIVNGLGGIEGRFRNLFDPYVAYSFGITVTIGLLSGPVGDQQHWQRAFAFRKGTARNGYLLGALIFAIVPVSLGLLGFIAAGDPQIVPEIVSGAVHPQQVGPEVVGSLLPGWGILLFMLMILGGLASTGDSALCAGGSMAVVDIYQRYLHPAAGEKEMLIAARCSIIGMALCAVFISLIPGVTILSLFLFYGTLRSSTFVPTLLILFKRTINPTGIFWGVLGAMSLGSSLYLYGERINNIHVKVTANIGVILISGAIPLLMSMKRSDSDVNLIIRGETS